MDADAASRLLPRRLQRVSIPDPPPSCAPGPRRPWMPRRPPPPHPPAASRRLRPSTRPSPCQSKPAQVVVATVDGGRCLFVPRGSTRKNGGFLPPPSMARLLHPRIIDRVGNKCPGISNLSAWMNCCLFILHMGMSERKRKVRLNVVSMQLGKKLLLHELHAQI